MRSRQILQRAIRASQRSLPVQALAHGIYWLARQLYQAERLPIAASLLSFGARVGGPDSWSLDFLGLIARRRGDPEKAVRYYEAALEVDPRNTRALGRLAHSLLRLGSKKRALATAEQLRLLGGVEIGFAYGFARYLVEREADHAEALRWFELAAASGDPTARMCVAHCLLNLGRPEEAQLTYEQLVTEDVHPSIALRSKLGVAKAEFDLGDGQAALRIAREALHEYEHQCDGEETENAREVVDWLEGELLDPPGSGL